MKKIYILVLLLFSQQLFSQYVSTGIGKWKLGLNVGATWQTADVSTDLFDLGYGATLEYAVHEKQNRFFGFSFRGRFLQGKTTGYEHIRHNGNISNNAINGSIDTSINYSFNPLFLNNKTSLNEFSLEGMLKWNRLYQNHGILFYLYIGGGFTNYKVESDQLDFNGSMYNYSSINVGNGGSTVNELKNIQDGNFETELSNPDYNSLVFTPAVGIGLGFRIVPGVDFALEHKISLPQTDLFDGQIHETGDPAFIQDIYHYTSLGLIFSIVRSVEPETYVPPTEPAEPITPVNTATPIKPRIKIVSPTNNTFNSPNCTVVIKAKINNVNEKKDISFYHNGNLIPNSKFYYASTIFKSTVELKEGNNNFKIIAKNGNLSTTKEFSLKCNNSSDIVICHKKNDGSSVTMNINENDWNQHAAHGDSKGACPDKQITICHNIPGGAGKTETITIPESKWAIHKSHGDKLGNCNEKSLITICHDKQTITIDEKDWSQHAAHGDTKGDCPQVNMITICHIPTHGDERVTMTIPENEWIVHQAHGDVKGSCPSNEPTITICHKNSNGTKSTITIPEFKWNEHFSHGDSKGSCPQIPFIICHKDPTTGKKKNISIYESDWAQHAAHGDMKGECPKPDKFITICHNIPGQPGKTETISILESQWLIHKSHGDKLGACIPIDKDIDICHKSGNSKVNMTIKESQWAQHAAHGDTKGDCPPDKDIEICHKSGNSKVNMTIKESQWAQHAAHGDTKGNCPVVVEKITICHYPPGNTGNPQTIQINASAWPAHEAHGDTKGECPKPDKYITICHNIPGRVGETKTITILESKWLIHKSHGDKLGACIPPDKDIDICHKAGNSKVNMTIKESQWAQHAAHGDTKGD
jgi:hypothetical protein